jgi:hypothetical protein
MSRLAGITRMFGWRRNRTASASLQSEKDTGITLVLRGFPKREDLAEERGREDALSGQHSIYSNADEPAEVTRVRAAEAQNAAEIRAGIEKAVVAARGAAEAARVEQGLATEAKDAADKALAEAEHALSGVSEERVGFAAIPRWFAWVAAGLLLLGDIFFTYTAVAGSIDVDDWESLVLAATIGALLFGVGIGKAYIDVVDFRGGEDASSRPWPAVNKKMVSRLLLWSATLMIIMLFFARVAIVDWDTVNSGEQGWQFALASIAGFLAVGFAAALVAIAAYLGAFVSFVSRPLAVAKGRVRGAAKDVKRAESRRVSAERAVVRADAALAQAEGVRAEAATVVRGAWEQVRAAYWRGFALERPEEQPLLRPLPPAEAVLDGRVPARSDGAEVR